MAADVTSIADRSAGDAIKAPSLPPSVDGRTWAARHFRDFAAELLSDLADPTAGERELVRRAAALAVLCAQIEARILAGETLSEVEAQRYLATLNAQRRVLLSVGLERRARDVSPRLADILGRTDD